MRDKNFRFICQKCKKNEIIFEHGYVPSEFHCIECGEKYTFDDIKFYFIKSEQFDFPKEYYEKQIKKCDGLDCAWCAETNCPREKEQA